MKTQILMRHFYLGSIFRADSWLFDVFLVFLRGNGEGSRCGLGERDHRRFRQRQSLSEPNGHRIQAAYCSGLLLFRSPSLPPVVFSRLERFVTAAVMSPACVSAQATGLSAETMRVVLERCYNDLRLLYVPNKTLKAEGFFRSNKVPLFSSYVQN